MYTRRTSSGLNTNNGSRKIAFKVGTRATPHGALQIEEEAQDVHELHGDYGDRGLWKSCDTDYGLSRCEGLKNGHARWVM